MEHKTSPAFVTKTDEIQGIVETVFAVFGNLDLGNDIIHPGAFAKTFVERGHKVKLLDLHNRDSVLNVLGKPLAFSEKAKDELPADLLKEYPEATGGAWAQVQFNMKTQNGHDAFQHFRAGDIDEWSFAYDSIQEDFSEIDKVNVRNLRELKLYELSPVIWGMNPATTTTSAKEQKPEPEETEETIRIRIKDPGGFQEGSFRTISIDKDRGIQAVIGRLEGETTTTIQAYIFNKEKGDWTVATAQAWVKEHSKTGRVLIAVDGERISPEVADFIAMLETEGIDIVGTSEAGPDDDTTHLLVRQAGPDGAPSNDDDLLRIITIKQKQLTLLEV